MRLFRLFGLALAASLLCIGSAAAQLATDSVTSTFKNVLDNPNFDVYQRGTTAVTAIKTPTTYHADRWGLYANSATASVTATNVTASLPAGFANAERVQRQQSNTTTAAICLIQEIPTSVSVTLAGKPVVLSANVKAGANFSAASSYVNFGLAYGTGTDQGLRDGVANWTGAGNVFATDKAVTTSWARYAVTATVPATATELAVKLCFTPVGMAGAADYFEATGIQLEVGNVPTANERRNPALELANLQRYFYQITEPAAGVNVVPAGVAVSTTNCLFTVPFPVTMRTAPTLTVSTITSDTTFKVQAAIQNSISALTAGTAHTTMAGTISATTAGVTAGHACVLKGNGGSATLKFSADF